MRYIKGMEYRRLGSSGLQLSALSFGSWVTFSKQVDQDVAYQLMTHAYDHGVNFFDNAEVYEQGQAELLMGNALKKAGWGVIPIVCHRRCFGVVRNRPSVGYLKSMCMMPVMRL